MQAVIQDRYGLPNVLSLGELAEPVPADNEFLLQVRAISLNGSDRENRMGGPASDFLRETGADRTIDFATKDWAAERNSHDLIVDLVANRSPFRVHRALRRGGRYAMVVGLARTLLAAGVAGPLVGRVTRKRVGVLVVPQSRAELVAVTALVAQGAVTPRIDRVYPLRDASAALARLAAGERRGKLVIDVSEG